MKALWPKSLQKEASMSGTIYMLISHGLHNTPACIVWQVEDGLADGGSQLDKPQLFLEATDTVQYEHFG